MLSPRVALTICAMIYSGFGVKKKFHIFQKNCGLFFVHGLRLWITFSISIICKFWSFALFCVSMVVWHAKAEFRKKMSLVQYKKNWAIGNLTPMGVISKVKSWKHWTNGISHKIGLLCWKISTKMQYEHVKFVLGASEAQWICSLEHVSPIFNPECIGIPKYSTISNVNSPV